VGGQLARPEVDALAADGAVLLDLPGPDRHQRTDPVRRHRPTLAAVQKHPQVVGAGAGKVVAEQAHRPAQVDDQDVAVAVVVVVGKDRPRHVGGRELRHEVVGGLEGAITEIAE
jgi:hypothetical protein